MKKISLLVAFVLFTGCSSQRVPISDLSTIPQNIEYYTSNLVSQKSSKRDLKFFNDAYFSVWHNKPAYTLEEISWPFYAYKQGESYGENLQLLEKSYFEKIKDNSNFEEYMSVNQKAITVRYSDIRSFPTSRPLFSNPNLAGEGFPFDYLQNSSIQANKPLYISHYSKDREWAYIFSSFAYGWIKTNQLAILNDKQSKELKNSSHIVVTKDDIPLYSENGDFLFHTKIGTILPIISEDEKFYTLKIVTSYKLKEPFFVEAKILKEYASSDFLSFNTKSLNTIVGNLSSSKYGWGGMFSQRDCSSTLRDMYIPFGVWLPRNSSQQAKVGKVISFDGLSREEIVNTIKEKGIPFKTLLYKKGHIMLYVGIYEDEIIIFHNTWGIKTEKSGVEGRIIIGKALFSTLHLGSNQNGYDENAELLRNLKSMNIVVE